MLHVQCNPVIVEGGGRSLRIRVTKGLRPKVALSRHDPHEHHGCGRDVVRTHWLRRPLPRHMALLLAFYWPKQVTLNIRRARKWEAIMEIFGELHQWPLHFTFTYSFFYLTNTYRAPPMYVWGIGNTTKIRETRFLPSQSSHCSILIPGFPRYKEEPYCWCSMSEKWTFAVSSHLYLILE